MSKRCPDALLAKPIVSNLKHICLCRVNSGSGVYHVMQISMLISCKRTKRPVLIIKSFSFLPCVFDCTIDVRKKIRF